jgi:hypothetical protein
LVCLKSEAPELKVGDLTAIADAGKIRGLENQSSFSVYHIQSNLAKIKQKK